MKKTVKFDVDDHEYEVNAVRYIVSSSFQNHQVKSPKSISYRFGRALKTHFSHLYRKCGYDTSAMQKTDPLATKEE